MRNAILIAGLLLLVVIVLWFQQRESGDGAREESALVDYNITSEQVDMMILRERLADTAWTWPEPDWPESKAWFQLKADGVAIAGWHRKPCLWTVTSGSTIKMIITSSSREVKEVKFNSDLSEAEMRRGSHPWGEGSEEHQVLWRIDQSIIEEYSQKRNKRIQDDLSRISY